MTAGNFTAALVLESSTDTLIRTEGFDESSFAVITAGAQWRVDMDDDYTIAPGDRQVLATSDSTINRLVLAFNTPFLVPSAPQTRMAFAVIDPATGALTPLAAPMDRIYLTVTRMFKDP